MKGLNAAVAVMILSVFSVVISIYAEESKESYEAETQKEVILQHAEEPAVSGSVSADIMSTYVWRGQTLSNAFVIQPAVSVSYGVFGASIWGNYDSDKVETTSGSDSGHGEFNEMDFTLSYARTVSNFTVGGGYIYYAFDGANDTQEVYLSGTYNGMFSPALTVYYDYDEGNGAFVIASVSHAFDLPQKMSLKLGASASYNIRNKIMGVDEDGERFSNFYNGELTSSLVIPLTDHISVTPKVAYSFPLSSEAKDAISAISNDNKKDIVYGGINLTLSF